MLKCKNRVQGLNYSEHLAGFNSFVEANAFLILYAHLSFKL
jgi:hypothetical protein